MKVFLSAFLLASAVLPTGCFYIGQRRFEDIVKEPPADWSSRDCLTIILSAMAHNLHDNEKNVECIATPFYPSVVVALNQIQRTQHHWSDDEAQEHLDELLRGSSGLYVDWRDGRFVNAKGNYFKDQTDIDSLLVVVTLRNKTWPCAVPTNFKGKLLMGLSDWPCYMPPTDDIDKRIWILNGEGDTLRPKFVWGRRHEFLTTTETLFVMFQFRRGEAHFLERSTSAWLQVAGFDTKMKFPLNVSRMR